ncbi:transposase [Spirosoma fluviale]|uniref:Transposase n=1 Tax=Spirosoma fluviale TaxID=1597977 RepID=A0A286GQK0_9BACT|nr:transposase [Spirosoma fluviale]SOD97788.1 Transposase [Spirosoma fluviale]
MPYGWQKKGHRLGLPARIATKRINLLGLLSLDNQLTVYHSEKALTGAFVVDCLADFVTKAHAKPVVIVLDNGPIHRCQAVYGQQSGWEEKDVYLFFLPAYSPHLNLIELVWKSLKYRWLKKADYKSWAYLKKAIFAIIRGFGQEYKIDFSEVANRNIIKINSA